MALHKSSNDAIKKGPKHTSATQNKADPWFLHRTNFLLRMYRSMAKYLKCSPRPNSFFFLAAYYSVPVQKCVARNALFHLLCAPFAPQFRSFYLSQLSIFSQRNPRLFCTCATVLGKAFTVLGKSFAWVESF